MFTSADDAILATIGAIKSICELLIAKKLVSADELAHIFDHHGNEYVKKRNADMASVMLLLLDPLERDAADQLSRRIQALPKASP